MKNIYSLTDLRKLVTCLFVCSATYLNAQCTATNVPYTEDFASATTPSVPACTSVQNSGTGAPWETYDLTSTPISGFTGNVLTYFCNYIGGASTWFYTRGLNLAAGTSYRLTYKYAAGFSFYNENMKVNYGTSATSSAMTNTLTNHFHFSNDFVLTQTVDFIPATTGVYYIGFNAYSDPNSVGILLDDITVDLSPSCVQPGTVNLTSLTAMNAMINWTGGTAAASWDVYYGASPLAVPSASTVPTATTTSASFSLTGLMASTAYDVYVRTHCSATDQSTWAPALSFTTPCVSANIPYTQDFESVTAPSLPACTSAENPGAGGPWETYNAPASSYGFSSNTLVYISNGGGTVDSWFYTQGLNLTAGTSYRLTYRYAAVYNIGENMRVSYGSVATSSAMTATLTNHFNFSSYLNAITDTVDFIPATTGVYYIGFNAYSNPNTYGIQVDDILVDLTPACNIPAALAVTNVTLTSAYLNWTAPSGGASLVNYKYEVRNAGAAGSGTLGLALSGTVTVPTNSVQVSGLTPSTTYSAYVRSDCGYGNSSSWSLANTFTTSACSITVSAVSSQSILCVGENAILTASSTTASSYTWSSNAGSVTTTTVLVSPTASTIYTITAVNGVCTATSSVNVTVNACTGIEEFGENQISFVPNPNNGQVTILLPASLAEKALLEVYDALGRQVIKATLTSSNNLLSTTQLEKGLYLYRIFDSNHLVKTGKMIRE